MLDNSQNRTEQNLDLGVNPQKNLPTPEPAPSLTPKFKSYFTPKIVSTILGMLLLVGGLGAGIILVKQPQLLEQHAQVINYPTPIPTPMPCNDGTIKSGTYFCSGNFTCLHCENGKNVAADRSLCPSPCYFVTPASLSNNCYHSQVDSSYGSTNVGGCPFSQNGCGQSVMSMILCDKKGSSLNPVQVNSTYYGGQSTCYGTTVDKTLDVLRQSGVSFTTPSMAITTANLRNKINNGKKVMILCKVNGIDHWTLAAKVTSGGGVVLSDPLFGDGNILGQTENIDMSTCTTAIVY